MRFFWILGFVGFSLALSAQIELGWCGDREDKEDPKARKEVDKGLKALNAKNLQMARIYIKNALKFDENDPHALYLLGELSLKEKRIPAAVDAWEKLIDICPDYLPEVHFFLGIIYLETGKQEKSVAMLEKFLANKERDRNFDREAKNAIKEVRLKKELLANPVDFDPRPVKDVSTADDEYLAIISPDGQYCFFTRKVKKVDKYSGPVAKTRMVEEFTLAERTNGKFTVGEPLPEPFNTSYNEGGPTVTADNKELFFTVCVRDKQGYQNCDIYTCKKRGYYWGDIEPLNDKINKPDSWESQPAVSANGDELYFVSNRKGGYGGLDLYVSKRLPNGDWDAPVNLGPEVNTPKDEKSPFLHSDSKTLYFASNGLPGLGGFDIFYTKQEAGEWEEPINIGYPINTDADELGLFVSLDGKTAYFNSNKLKGPGGWDLYAFDLHLKARPERVALIKGRLLDDLELPDPDAKLEIKNLKTQESTQIQVDDQSGEYAAVVRIKEKEDLIVKVKKEGSAFSSKLIDSDENLESDDLVVNADLKVSPIEVGKEYRLNDINFATNSYELTQKSKYIIDEFYLFLMENPNVKVSIQGHTDNIGNPNDNKVLSQNRARVVFDYLIERGIPSSRLRHEGFGESKPVATNQTEEGRSRNRRTVFLITAK